MAGKKRMNIGHNKTKEIKTSCTINVFTPCCPQLVSQISWRLQRCLVSLVMQIVGLWLTHEMKQNIEWQRHATFEALCRLFL